MRSGGIHWLAVIAAAVAIYAIGFVIFGVLVSQETMMAMSGRTESEQAMATARLTFSPLMPILTAVFMAILFKLGSVDSVEKGVKWAVVLAMASAIPTILYRWVYGGVDTDMTLIDGAHLLLGHIAAGAILGGWR
jgi:hypothetical protein